MTRFGLDRTRISSLLAVSAGPAGPTGCDALPVIRGSLPWQVAGGKREAEDAPSAFGRLDPDAAAVRLDDAPADREADARPVHVRGDPREHVEHVWDVLAADPDAVVAHAHDPLLAPAVCGHLDPQRSVGTELDGIGEEVLEHPPQLARVAVHLRQLPDDEARARVVEGAQVKRGDASVNGLPAVVLVVTKQPHVDTRALTDRVVAALREVEGSLPANVVVNPELYQLREFIDRGLFNVGEALAIGAGLVLVVLFLFLLNVRTTFISLTAIPLSLAVTALVFQAVIVAIFSYLIWYNMMRRYPVNQVMPFTLLLPMIGVLDAHITMMTSAHTVPASGTKKRRSISPRAT